MENLDAKFSVFGEIALLAKSENKSFKLKLDFGFGGEILIPNKLEKLFLGKKKETVELKMRTLSGQTNTLRTIIDSCMIEIGGFNYMTKVRVYSNYAPKYGLIGVAFLKQNYKTLILDYENKKVFVQRRNPY